MMLATLSLMLAVPTAPIRLEAELGTLEGVTAEASRPGFSGTGYVTDFSAANARVTWRFKASPGIYVATLGYRTPSGTKGVDVTVNGRRTGGQFPDSKGAFSRYAIGRVEVDSAEVTLTVERGWGYFDLDYVELTPAPPPKSLRPVPATLTNPKASPEAKSLMRYLTSQYGRTTLSGQYEMPDTRQIIEATGRMPAIYGSDFMDYSPSRVARGASPEGSTELMIRRAKAGQIVTLSWHWNAPSQLLDKKFRNERGEEVDASWYKGFYTNATNFDVRRAVQPGTEEHRLVLRDIDAIAKELRKFQAAKVPVLWRPLHEAEGGWFWWGAKGPEPCKELWRLLRRRLETHHKLNNLIWVWNSGSPAWYPGHASVDVMSVDLYPDDWADPTSGPWEDLRSRFDGNKLLALAEFPGTPDIDRMARFGVRWSFFVGWSGFLTAKGRTLRDLRRIYQSSQVRNAPYQPQLKR